MKLFVLSMYGHSMCAVQYIRRSAAPKAALTLTSDDCVFEATSPAPDGQRHVGHAAIGIAWKPIFDDVMSRFTVEDSFTAGDRVVQCWRYDWDDGHVRGIDVFTVKDGKVTEKIAYVKG